MYDSDLVTGAYDDSNNPLGLDCVGGMYILTLNPGMYSDYYGNLRPVIGVDSAHTLGELIAKLAYSVV